MKYSRYTPVGLSLSTSLKLSLTNYSKNRPLGRCTLQGRSEVIFAGTPAVRLVWSTAKLICSFKMPTKQYFLENVKAKKVVNSFFLFSDCCRTLVEPTDFQNWAEQSLNDLDDWHNRFSRLNPPAFPPPLRYFCLRLYVSDWFVSVQFSSYSQEKNYTFISLICV